MSEDDTLFYNGRRLVVKADGYEFSMDSLPAIDALPANTTEIDVYRRHCKFKLREGRKPEMRDMHAPEIEAVFRFWRKVAQFGCGLYRRQR